MSHKTIPADGAANPLKGVTRRTALLGASAAGMMLAAGAGRAQSTQMLVKTGLPAQKAKNAQHSVVYREEDEFCAWAFYCGLWKTADGSIVAGFKRVPTAYGSAQEIDHTNMTRNKGEIVVIRSTDNGKSWDRNSIVPIFDMAIKSEKDFPGGAAADWSGLPPLDFRSRDTLIMGGGVPALFAPNARCWMRASTDGGRTWRAHTLLPNDDFPSLSMPGSSMYSVRQDGMMLLGLHTNAPGALGPRPIVYGCIDGVNWQYLGSIVDEEKASPYYPGGSPFAAAPHFYPRVVVLRNGKVLASVRYQRDARNVIWTEIHESLDGGRTWHWLSRVNDWGAPGDLVPMSDGRVVCVYGYRMAPYGIRYRVSEDEGRTWGQEYILRDDGGSWDVGYPRVVEIAPGTLLSTYYINLKNDRINVNGGVRHIACTVFKP
ncbi:sialidase family protein [Sphingobium nicotianae]|uniref:Glycoside hydrolase n=1 Tax=Sphingobium nicotianae TaxID=2782607 RepID=A0A9X1DDI1_9SPHN|nr:sialidase family protein [Sphingobium nicotianae]MBT2188215.1 glycoside hydrolase [Sphingobium nicotianae]